MHLCFSICLPKAAFASILSSVDMKHATMGEFWLYVLCLRANYYGMSVMALVVFCTGNSCCGTKTTNENLFETLQHDMLLSKEYYAFSIADI